MLKHLLTPTLRPPYFQKGEGVCDWQWSNANEIARCEINKGSSYAKHNEGHPRMKTNTLWEQITCPNKKRMSHSPTHTLQQRVCVHITTCMLYVKLHVLTNHTPAKRRCSPHNKYIFNSKVPLILELLPFYATCKWETVKGPFHITSPLSIRRG